MALTDSLSTITAYANDVSYDAIFSETLKNFARPGDLLIAISGSGNSPNVLLAADAAHAAGCRTITLTGRDGGRLAARAKLNILAPDQAHGADRGCSHDRLPHDCVQLYGARRCCRQATYRER